MSRPRAICVRGKHCPPACSRGDVSSATCLPTPLPPDTAAGSMPAAPLRHTGTRTHRTTPPPLHITAFLHPRVATPRLATHAKSLVEQYPPPDFQYARAHVASLLGRRQQGRRLRFRHDTSCALGGASRLRDAIAAARSTADLAAILRRCLEPAPPPAAPSACLPARPQLPSRTHETT